MSAVKSVHKTVLLNETIEGLNLSRSKASGKQVVIDATFGGGGHSLEICKKFPGTKIIAIDQDKSAFKKAKDKFEGLDCDITVVNTNFSGLKNLKDFSAFALGDIRTGDQHDALNLEIPKVDAIIFDLGLSSDQLENSGRGFSFMKDEPLFMTMKENPSPEDLTAMDVVNGWGEENLANIIYGYGEEKYSRRIARAIVDFRQKKDIKTTFDLVEIIRNAVPMGYQRGRLHFATKTFQAIRIAVNDELGVLKEGLEGGFQILKSGGRISVISFHSLEDRIVKNFFRDKVKNAEAILINKKPILAERGEIRENPRSRSAKLRIIEKNK